MPDLASLAQLIERLAYAPLVAAFYWAILIAAAALEMAFPGRSDRLPLGPRLRVNFAFGLSTMLLYAIPFLSEVALAEWVRARGWGLFNRAEAGLAWHLVLSFLAYDLCGYTIHRLSHRFRWLWRLHRVHHSDSDLDLSTYFRSHPLDVMVILGIKFAAIVGLGLHPAALVLHGLAKQVTMSLGHANIAPRPRLSRAISAVFVSPAFHQTHHSAHRPDTDSNYGEVLTVWDRLFASAGRTGGAIERFGLGDAYDADSASLAGQLKLPFVSRQ